jgi:hypothetical protein
MGTGAADLAGLQIIAGGNTLGTVAGAASDNFVGCTFARTGAGAYTVLFNTEPPGLTTPKNVIILLTELAIDPAATGAVVTKTTDASGNCTGFTVATTAAADEAWGFVAYRLAQAV